MSVIKKIEKRNIKLFILIGILLLIIIGVKAYFDFFRKDDSNKIIDNLSEYNYTVSKSDTELFKTTFNELKTILNEEVINYENYAKTLSKLFIIDVFSLENKTSSQDIGGLEYIHPDYIENFKLNMSQTLYKYLETTVNNDRTQDLPLVTEVTITNTFNTTYEYNKTKYEAYIISLTWNYDKDLDYQRNMDVTLIKDNNKLFIVKGK